ARRREVVVRSSPHLATITSPNAKSDTGPHRYGCNPIGRPSDIRVTGDHQNIGLSSLLHCLRLETDMPMDDVLSTLLAAVSREGFIEQEFHAGRDHQRC